MTPAPKNPQDNKNLLLAIGLSTAVLLGWNYFYAVPQMNKQKEAAALATAASPVPAAGQGSTTPAVSGTPGAAPATATVVETAIPRDQALAKSPRVTIDAPRLKGSIALKGARIDDVSLVNYRETIDPKSPNIVLFEPSGAPNPYYAEFGFADPAAKIALPNADSLWSADKTSLTPDSPVTLSFDNGAGLTFKRTISIDQNYMFDVKDSVENKGTEAVSLYPYALIARRNIPLLAGYGALHEGLLGLVGDSGIQELTYAAVEKKVAGKEVKEGTGGWVGFTDKYWAAALIPAQDKAFAGTFSASQDGGKSYQTSTITKDALVIAPQSTGSAETHLFAGAKETQTIDAYQAKMGIKSFDLMIDWGWFYFITKPLFRVMDYIYKLIGNFGVAILLTTVLIRLVLFPIANRSYQSMAKMKLVQPQMQAIKEKFPDDKQKQQQAIMELYKKEKINPVSGCLPMLIQIPIFFALYKVILVTIEMRHAPFFGWIKDLSAPDPTSVMNLFGLLPFDPSILPSFLHIGIWPLIMGVTMFLQMKMNPEPTDPVQKQMFTYMPIVFTFMLGAFPAGLVIYWTWSNILSVLQQGYISKKAGNKIELFDNLKKLFVKSPA